MIKRSFCIGSEWLYFKIYTGVRTADIILKEKLAPILSSLVNDKTILKWFFIRYNDPDDHIRIRFYSERKENIAIIIDTLYPVFENLLDSLIIWKLQTDTYEREIERYGDKTIIDSESIFYYDSEMILEYIFLKPYFEKEETQLLFSFLAIDSFLNTFSLNIFEKLTLLDGLQESFKKEFDASKQLKKEFDKNYRELSDDIDSFLTHKMATVYAEIYRIIYKKEKEIEKTVLTIKNNIQIQLDSFLSSHIHMMLNRQYKSKQRYYECLIYEHLFRYYKMIHYKSKV